MENKKKQVGEKLLAEKGKEKNDGSSSSSSNSRAGGRSKKAEKDKPTKTDENNFCKKCLKPKMYKNV